MCGLTQFEAQTFDFYNFLFNKLIIKKYGSAMDEDLNPKVEVRSSSPCSCNL
jgi:hypothetical protein